MPNDNNLNNAAGVIEICQADIVNEDNLVLSDVNIKIDKGELVYFVGRVGSGKTSIIKTLIAELPLQKGSAKVCGYELGTIRKKQVPMLRRNLGVVFQDFQLLAEQTVMENLMFVLKATGWEDERKMEERCMRVLSDVEMVTKAHKLPHQLSGGEQQRIAIARALLNEPQVILADEPTGNLDAETADGIMKLLMQIHSQSGTAIVIVTHNRTILDKYPGRIILCAKGECKEVTNQVSGNLQNLQEDMPG